MNSKFLNRWRTVLIFCFCTILANETLELKAESPDKKTALVIPKKDSIGLLQVTKKVKNPFQILCPLAELLSKEHTKAVILFLGNNMIDTNSAWPLMQDINRLGSAYNKPIIAYSESRLSGNDYITACGTNAIVVAPLTKVGGIEFQAYLKHSYDQDKRDGKMLNYFSSGKFIRINKHILPPASVVQMYEHFVRENFTMLTQDIATVRPKAGVNRNRWAEGNWFNAKDALALGLINAIADKVDLVGYVLNMAGSVARNITNTQLLLKQELDRTSFLHVNADLSSTIGILKIEKLRNQQRDQYGQHLLELFRDKAINKIVLYISCVDGDYFAAKNIYNDILKLKLLYKKPVIAYIDKALGEGYYVATAADYCLAAKGAYIGCISSAVTRWDITKKDKDEHLKIVSLSTGKFLTMENTHMNLTKENKEVLQMDTELAHKAFVQAVKTSRPKLKNKEEEQWAEGQLFTAREALELGLIDEIGSPLDALYYGVQEKNYRLHEVPFIFKSINQNSR